MWIIGALFERRTLNPALNFHFFITYCKRRVYEMVIFGELVDNGLRGCISVVGTPPKKNLRNRGYKVCLNTRTIVN